MYTRELKRVLIVARQRSTLRYDYVKNSFVNGGRAEALKTSTVSRMSDKYVSMRDR